MGYDLCLMAIISLSSSAFAITLSESGIESLAPTSDDDNEIMAIRHKSYPIVGVQFHPESIMTPEGKKILGNFVKFVEDQR